MSEGQRRRGLACERCRGRKQKCLPGDGGKCSNCAKADTECLWLEKTMREDYLERRTQELLSKIQRLEAVIAAADITLSPHEEYLAASPPIPIPDRTRRRDNVQDTAGPSSEPSWARVLTRPMGITSSRPSTSNGISNRQSPQASRPPDQAASQYLATAYFRIQARYGFLDWQAIQSWQSNAQALCQLSPLGSTLAGCVPKEIEQHFGAFFLWALYGLGAKLSGQPLVNGASHETFYRTAMRHYIPLAGHLSTTNVQALLLLAVYTFHHPASDINLWQITGMATRLAVEVGLHRRARYEEGAPIGAKDFWMRQRTFWAAYVLDRMVSQQMGRPFAIDDLDIEVQYPVNVEATFVNEGMLGQALLQANDAAQKDGQSCCAELTSMSSFIHTIRLNRLRSRIQNAVYRQVSGTNLLLRQQEVSDILTALDEWRSHHPKTDGTALPACSSDFFEIEYHNCVQVLLRPLINLPGCPVECISRCAASAAALLDVECKLLRKDPKNLATWVLSKIFASGITMMQILISHPDILPHVTTLRAMRSCSTCLFLYAQEFPASASPYLDSFEELVRQHDERLGHLVVSPSAPQVTVAPNYIDVGTSGWNNGLYTDWSTSNATHNFAASTLAFNGQTDLFGAEGFGNSVRVDTTLGMPAPVGPDMGPGANWDLPFEVWNGADIDFGALFEGDAI